MEYKPVYMVIFPQSTKDLVNQLMIDKNQKLMEIVGR